MGMGGGIVGTAASGGGVGSADGAGSSAGGWSDGGGHVPSRGLPSFILHMKFPLEL